MMIALVLVEEREPRWQDDAACLGATSLFYSTSTPDILAAKQICMELCPVLEECREEAAATETSANAVFGVRAGMSARERKRLVKQPRRGGRT
jgi:hypothetical protein